MDDVTGLRFPSFIYDRQSKNAGDISDYDTMVARENAERLESFIGAIGSEFYMSFLTDSLVTYKTRDTRGEGRLIYAYTDRKYKPIQAREAIDIGRLLVSEWKIRVSTLMIPSYCDSIVPLPL